MSIIERTTKLELTQYSGSSVKAQFYANYNSDMQKIDGGYATLDEAINGEEGLGARVSALETSITTIDEKADNAVSIANDAKTTAEGFDTRVTTLEGKVSDLETWAGGVDTTLEAYDGRLDAIEDVIATVSTANINDLIARMDALEQKVDANTQSIDTLNDNLISAVNRIVDLETGLGTTNANLNALAGRVTLLEGCCEEVRTTLADHNTRINKNASDISALDARMTRDETNIAGNASDIVILATQNSTQADQIDDLYSKYNALDPASPSSLISRVTTLEGVVGDTPLQTTAQTVTAAINELYEHATDVDADEVDYDNTNSGLVATDVQGAIDEVVGSIGSEDARVEALETTVGGAGSGLVKDVGDLQTSVGTLETTVGDNNAGLVKDVADLGVTVGDNSAGLVKDVSDLQTTVGDATAGLVKDVADLQTDVAGLTLPSGMITPYGGATAPSGWLLCDGTAVSRETYADLFAAIGTTFGTGDGSTTFNIPNLQDKFVEGASSTNTLGSTKNAGLPNITGTFNADNLHHGGGAWGGAFTNGFVHAGNAQQMSSGVGTTSDNSISFDASLSNNIYGASNTVQPPAVCINYIIKV